MSLRAVGELKAERVERGKLEGGGCLTEERKRQRVRVMGENERGGGREEEGACAG